LPDMDAPRRHERASVVPSEERRNRYFGAAPGAGAPSGKAFPK
jgi:hypothetical protein